MSKLPRVVRERTTPGRSPVPFAPSLKGMNTPGGFLSIPFRELETWLCCCPRVAAWPQPWADLWIPLGERGTSLFGEKLKTGRDREGEAPAEPHGARTCWGDGWPGGSPPPIFYPLPQGEGRQHAGGGGKTLLVAVLLFFFP